MTYFDFVKLSAASKYVLSDNEELLLTPSFDNKTFFVEKKNYPYFNEVLYISEISYIVHLVSSVYGKDSRTYIQWNSLYQEAKITLNSSL